jgi:hypothetical protein
MNRDNLAFWRKTVSLDVTGKEAGANANTWRFVLEYGGSSHMIVII